LRAQEANAGKPEPDVLILQDDEKLIGHVQSATSSSLVFKSDLAGEFTIDWSKVKELHTSEKFAAVPKNVKIRGTEEAAKVPQGTVSMSDQKLQVRPPQGPEQSMPVADLGNLVPQPAFQSALERKNFFQGWKGGATLGISLTESTQKSRSYTGAVNLVRAVPIESWLDLRSRTIFDFNEAYGKITQPNTPSVKTSLFHFGL
jgi:hypothetical protein